eukprot:m51a1_g5432 hypothetical protein (440) ;mRNA; r:160324-161893
MHRIHPATGLGLALLAALASATPRYFVQVTDIHLDNSYTVGARTDCVLYSTATMPCCHRYDVGKGSAGPYGAPLCDLAPAMLTEAMRALRGAYPSPDFIVFTGDSPSHMIQREWDSRIIRATDDIFAAFNQFFPKTPVLPVLGNHDVFPLYNIAAKGDLSHLTDISYIWSKWIKAPENQETVKRHARSGAFYQMKIAPKIRVLVLNTNYYAKKNLLVTNNDNPMGQKEFAESTLATARRNGEAVWILVHMPVGDPDLKDEYNAWYSGLVSKYSDVIKGQLAGHMHYDELRIVRDPATHKAVGHMYVAPSLTPYRGGNKNGIWPAVRVWQYEPTTGELLDYTQMHVDMNAAMRAQNPTVSLVKGYSAKAEWGIRDLSTRSWESVLGAGAAGGHMKHYMKLRQANPKAPEEPCDADCVKDKVCTINHSTAETRSLCLQGRL